MKPMDLMEALGNVPDELKAAALSDEAGTHPASAAAAPAGLAFRLNAEVAKLGGYSKSALSYGSS